MIGRVLRWLFRGTPEHNRPEGQSCGNCRHFIDYSAPDDDPDEPNGYCGQLVDALGIAEAVKVNPYGGHWTHHAGWCRDWEGGEKIWVRATEDGDP